MKKIVAVLVLILTFIWLILWVGSYFDPSWRDTAEKLGNILQWIITALAVASAVLLLRR
jgi:TRAP-type C4-dicarboxylate transport system permease small subunit